MLFVCPVTSRLEWGNSQDGWVMSSTALSLRRNVCFIVDHEFDVIITFLHLGGSDYSPSMLTAYSAVELISLFAVNLR
jgi:hypothetical protein